jgi:WD40 repeat protein
MAFRPNVGDELTLNGVTYRIAEHPAAPGIPYGQEGRAGIVYQLLPADRSAGFQPAALKVFRARFRTPALVSQAEKLAAFADLPGLTVCRRTVLTPTRHADLLRREPDLTYAVLMPWIEGPTWVEVMLEKRPLTPQQALDLARAFSQVLVRMEEQGLAHCDLSGPNVLLPMLTGQTADRRPQTAYSPSSTVELVDVEGLYAPGLPRPEVLPSGSAGYAHRTAREGLWGPTADRFAGAVLLAEMLGWGDETVRQACYGETYFDPAEMPSVAQASACDRYQTLLSALARHYGQPVADLFERAWRSETLADCPTFGEWLVALPEHPVAQAFSLSTPAAETTAGEQPTSPQESATVDATAEIRAFMQAARRMEDKHDLDSALKLYRQALELAQSDPSLRSLAREIELTVQDVEKRAAYDTQVLKPRHTSPLPAGEGPGVRSSPLPVGEGPEVRPSPLPSEEGEGVRAEGPGVRAKRPWRWLAAALVILSLLAAIVYGVNLQRQQAAQATATATAWQEQNTATAQAQSTATAQAQAAATAQAQATATTRIRATQTAVAQATATAQARILSPANVNQITTLRTLRGHTAPVWSVAFSPDGRRLASGSWDNTIKLWDVETGQEVRTLRGHTGGVWSMAFSPDGRLLASGSVGGTVKLWDVGVATKDFSSPPEVRTLRGHSGGVLSVAFSPDGRLLASNSVYYTKTTFYSAVELWNVETGQKVRTLSGAPVGSVAFSPDGRLLAAGSDEGTVKLWDVGVATKDFSSPPEVRTLRGHTGGVESVAFSPDGRLLASASSDQTVKLWDVATGQEVRTLRGHTWAVTSVAFSPDGRLLASASGDQTVKLWDVATGQEVRTLSGHNGGVESVAFSPDGRLLASGSSDGTVRIWGVGP